MSENNVFELNKRQKLPFSKYCNCKEIFVDYEGECDNCTKEQMEQKKFDDCNLDCLECKNCPTSLKPQAD